LTPATANAAWDVASLTRFLDGDHREVRQRVRTLLADPRFACHRDDGQGRRRQVLERCTVLASEGLGRLHLPRSCGGAGDPAAYLAVVETLGLGDLSLLVVFGVQFGLFAGSILALGTDAHHRRYLPAAGRFDLAGCFAMTETDHGSNIRDLETVARYDPATESFVLHTPHPGAGKDYIGNALEAHMAVVFARLEVAGEDRGVHPFVVPLRAAGGGILPGRHVEDCGGKAGLNGVGNARLAFDQVRLPRESLLDRFGRVSTGGTYTTPIESPARRFLTMLGTLVPGRVSVAAAALSATKRALTIAVRYGAGRRQFGPPGAPETPILDYLVHQRRLLPPLATTYALHFAVRHAGREVLAAFAEGRTGADRRRVDALAAGVKAVATWHAVTTVQTCRECCGGQGYLAVNELGPLRSDVDVFTTFEGDNTVLLQLAAKSLLADVRGELEKSTRLDVLRHLARPVAVRATTATAARHRLRDRRFQLEALRWRERHLLAELGGRLKRAVQAGEEADEAFLARQDHAVEAALAHIDRVVLEAFAAAVDSCPDFSFRPVLALLCDLYALGRIEVAAAWFLEHRYLGPHAARALRPQINALCADVRPHALALVAAFDIPDAVLAAPIGRP
jgi:acyl-CoA oxidase